MFWLSLSSSSHLSHQNNTHHHIKSTIFIFYLILFTLFPCPPPTLHFPSVLSLKKSLKNIKMIFKISNSGEGSLNQCVISYSFHHVRILKIKIIPKITHLWRMAHGICPFYASPHCSWKFRLPSSPGELFYGDQTLLNLSVRQLF